MQYFTILQHKLHSFNIQDDQSMRGLLGVDHLIFDGGVVQIRKKISSICFWLKKNILQNS